MWTFCCCCYLQGQSHSKGSYDQNMTLSTILSEVLICPFLATKLGLMLHHQKPECPMKTNWSLHLRSRPQWRVKRLMYVQMISSKPWNILFSNSVLWFTIMSQSVMQKRLLFWRSVSLQELIWSKYDSTVSSELLNLLVWELFDGTLS